MTVDTVDVDRGHQLVPGDALGDLLGDQRLHGVGDFLTTAVSDGDVDVRSGSAFGARSRLFEPA
ncbi:unannotated protein [freshwater metagenome]|uniref:Unannotated protein n=1 Tax=freshwater metagenome TaxID=449393 RepID=A0A6J7IX45_9ZZZZ